MRPVPWFREPLERVGPHTGAVPSLERAPHMGVPPLPRDPHDPYQTQPGQPAGQQPYPGPMPPPPPQPQIVYVQVPEQSGGRRQRKQVSRGKVGASGHSMHLILTVCTCGCWAPVWFLHWLFTRSKTVTRG